LIVVLVTKKESGQCDSTCSLLVDQLSDFLIDRDPTTLKIIPRSENQYYYNVYKQPLDSSEVTSTTHVWDKTIAQPIELKEDQPIISCIHIPQANISKAQVLQDLAKKFGVPLSQAVLVDNDRSHLTAVKEAGGRVVDAKSLGSTQAPIVKEGIAPVMQQLKLQLEGAIAGEARLEFSYNSSTQQITIGPTTRAAAVWRKPIGKDSILFDLSQSSDNWVEIKPVIRIQRYIREKMPGSPDCLPLLSYIMNRSQQGWKTHFGFGVFRQHKSGHVKISAAIALLNIILGVGTETILTDVQKAAILERPSGLNDAVNQLDKQVCTDKLKDVLRAQTPVAEVGMAAA